MEPKHKRSKKTEERLDLDKLSSLPDSILTHILSFVDTKSSIRTSILSKRYKLLWTLSPSLDFTFPNDRFDSYDLRSLTPHKIISDVTFEDCVNRILELREHCNLDRFRMSCHKDVTPGFLQSCIRYAARHKVQHLKIRACVKENSVALPESLLNSSYLTSLHLHNAISDSITLPKSVCLPGLKVLSLKNFEFCDKNFDGEVFVGCPNLETLVLGKCSIRQGNRLKCLEVSCSNLKNLEIRYWRSPWECFDEHMISVRAPKLAYFLFQGHLARVGFVGDLACIQKACFDLLYPRACSLVDISERNRKNSESFLGILSQIRNVRILSLSKSTIEVMGVVRDLQSRAPIAFENLRKIKLAFRNMYREVTMSVKSVMELLGKVGTDDLIFDGSKEKKVLPESSNVKKKKARNVVVPAHVMRFLLESSPSLELLGVEIPKESSRRRK